ncbi:hypothetical protein COCC4DRAFT_35763 [Bipolaris maydis ATCC 48331]|uniref:tRNA(Phe) 7-[(3-amino-3-carboxypropyl)-4-demethylwyosine(37)-N(4)]-methyltransferase n=2 Tax=Cochliobolus heterostrophus TaxID=5016 RepID=M2V8G1_COCH5|nr:uncharacterized protein COCC4DRAFT_35763 [Bipolaris maydis ATCC 48331]EMD96018.1 hypothetical protein COCHEDRAFT_1166792 [Bipolaris maydis C5]KAH7561897.1 hypothetical protein BM1_03001 [Bipolaris maydis]ENI10876.1 hypothetical protein COCC4DRAFT_35763 [Bipolaris maydis ATCC 48331]KAJ5030718.1 methyltransferase TYW3-domain-containing protein [Bipolaris maydis]KAJ5065737.1 methyltransferase TYW3-domain-containing protein [Bipolaris maydis]
MTTRFAARKQKILAQLDTPDADYHDLSPKGSVDAPIRGLIGEINRLEGFVTTSSCSGRISVFLEGRKAESAIEDLSVEGGDSRAGPGGKGGGGAWLFLSHEPVQNVDANHDFLPDFGLKKSETDDEGPTISDRYIHLKFEPMILHILTASIDDAQHVLNAALAAGFRESGAVSLGSTKGESNPIVAVRSAGYSFDSIVGYQNANGDNIALVNARYLQILVSIANERFKINLDRIARFRNTLLETQQQSTSHPPDWEDADARKKRKREEGLARQQALRNRDEQENRREPIERDLDDLGGMFS